MTGRRGCLVCLACAVVLVGAASCRRQRAAGGGEAEHHDDHTAGAKGHDEDHGHKPVVEGPTGIVRVHPEMVRDLRVTTKKAENRPGGEGVRLLGELQVNQDAYAEIGAPISGRVVRVLVAAGDQVKAGQVLAELESVELGKARAAEVTAQARAGLARQALERKRGLFAERVVPERELQEAQAEASAAEAEARAARTTLQALGSGGGAAQAARAGGARFALRTPVAGTVLDRDIARGQVVDPDKQLYRVADLSTLWLTVHAFERDALLVKAGTLAQVTFPALPGRTFEGKVIWVGSQVDVASRTIPVRVMVSNADGVLRPGMSATARVAVGDTAAAVVTVPAAAVQRLDRDWVVFLPKGGRHSFEIRKVGRGRDLSGEVEILSGIEGGDTVVVDGAFLLKAEAEKARGMGEQHEH